MSFLRNHWYDLGGILAIITAYLLLSNYEYLSNYEQLMWWSLISLFAHQLEEYRIVGTFPGMANTVMFKSQKPDRYPLNSQTSLIVNVVTGWLFYLLAAVFAEKAVWLGIATIMVSLGNTIAHTLIFNIKGKTNYNAGMASSLIFFFPIVIIFFYHIHNLQIVSIFDYILGVPLGILLNYLGIIKLIDWMKNENTEYIFPSRNIKGYQ